MTDTHDPPAPSYGASSLHKFSPELIQHIEALSVLRNYKARDVIYFPGDSMEWVYWIETGRIRISRISWEGRHLTLRHQVAGDFFGEDCLTGDTKRCDHAEAMESSRLRLMCVSDFRELLASDPAFTRSVLDDVLQRAREMDQVYSETVFRTVRERVAAGLLRLCPDDVKGGYTLRVTHEEVANYVGSTRETTTSVLRGLRESGVVEIGNRRVTVLDFDALRTLARQ